MDNQLKYLTEKVLKFRDERNWEKFHAGKDLAMCLSIESSELLELFLWKTENEADLEKLKDEMADVFYSLLLLSAKYNIDLGNILEEKIKKIN